MACIIYRNITRPDRKLVEAFREVPTSIVSDVMNRSNAMHHSVKPLVHDISFAGTAVTVQSMVGDNIMSHYAISEAEPGDVIVIDAKGHLDTAVWGYVQTRACILKNIEAVVIDGSTRDAKEIRESRFPLFCKGVCPTGPHKGWGGSINNQIQCAGVTVQPGDIVIGDDDGVTVVPQGIAEEVLEKARDRIKLESEWMSQLESGMTTVQILGFERKMNELGVEFGDQE